MLEVKTPSGKWEQFCKQVLDFLKADIISLNIDGKAVRGYRSPDSPALWIRDHSDILRSGRYIEPDVSSAVECFASAQAANGRIFDCVTTSPLQQSSERENWEKWVRVPVEADVEYRFVKAAYLAWQAHGDEAWLRNIVPALEQALTYSLSHPWRWDETHQLLKRPYTVDTWDFDYTGGRGEWLNFQITDHTYWGIFHGDNSGMFEAAQLLSKMCRAVRLADAAERWRTVADELRRRANALLFNGRFYTHFYKLTPVIIDSCDEAEQLSLSNAMAINRGLASHEIAVAILREYQKRRESTGAFAEWFGIDPPFPDGIFGDPKLIGGAYVNGGIFPLVGGELARAAFEHGFEQYGLQTLEQYRKMIAESKKTYLWYFPDGTPGSIETSTSPDAMPTDGWGASAMLYALVEGLCGIQDRGHSYENVLCAPRWIASDEEEVRVHASYAASGASFRYRFQHEKANFKIHLSLAARHAAVDLHLLLPENCLARSVIWNGKPVPFGRNQMERSPYVDTNGLVKGQVRVEIVYEPVSN